MVLPQSKTRRVEDSVQAVINNAEKMGFRPRRITMRLIAYHKLKRELEPYQNKSWQAQVTKAMMIPPEIMGGVGCKGFYRGIPIFLTKYGDRWDVALATTGSMGENGMTFIIRRLCKPDENPNPS